MAKRSFEGRLVNLGKEKKEMISVKKIRFLHIPKTAGSSFIACLKRIYGRGKHFFGTIGFPEEDLSRYAKVESKNKIRLIGGHGFRFLGLKEIDELPTITFLREPIGRVKSFCQHVLEGKIPHLLNRFPPEEFNLDDFLQSSHPELSNNQVRILASYQGEITKRNYKKLVDYAVDTIKNDIVCFGLTEYFDISLMMMMDTLNWPWPTYSKLNKTKKSKLLYLNDKHTENIKEMNFADIKLYKIASNILHERVNKDKERIFSLLAEFEKHQRAFQMYSWLYVVAGTIQKKIAPPEWYVAGHRVSDGK